MDRNHRALQLVEGHQADVAAGKMAARRLWARLRTACYRPSLSEEDIDDWARELRLIEQGLAAATRCLVEQRDEV